MTRRLHEALQGTPGEKSEALEGVNENIAVQIDNATDEGRAADAERLISGQAAMAKNYVVDGRISTGAHSSAILKNVRENSTPWGDGAK